LAIEPSSQILKEHEHPFKKTIEFLKVESELVEITP
jgi:hypothetical protein